MATILLAHMFVVTILILLIINQVNAQVSCQREVQPSTTPCGVLGKLTSSGEYYVNANPSAADSLNSCRDLCVRRGTGPSSGCHMFSFNETGHICNIYRSDNKNNIQQQESSDSIFFSRRCFKCLKQTCPPQPISTVNLLDNPGFETSNAYIGPWRAKHGTAGIVDTAAKPLRHPGIKSPSALHVGNDYTFNQDYRHCLGQTHRAEVDIYDVIPNPSLPLKFGAGDNSVAGSGFSFPITTPRSRSAKKVVGFYGAARQQGVVDLSAETFGSGGSFNFDNVVIRPVEYSSVKAIGKELAINGGFEQGTKPWNFSAQNLAGKHVGTFKLIFPGLDGSHQALRWYQKPPKKIDGLQISLTPKVQKTNTGKLHRLSFKTSPVLTMSLVFSDGSQIFGLTSDDQYFYVENGMFPLTIAFNDYNNAKTIHETVFDELSIREIEDLG